MAIKRGGQSSAARRSCAHPSTPPERPLQFTLITLALVMGVFFLAGGVKGLLGIGLPTVALALLIHAMPLREAVTLIVIPAIATNIWQALTGGRGVALFKRFWLYLALLCVATWLGVGILAKSDQRLLNGLFGGMLGLYALIGLTLPVPPPPGRAEPWLSPALGFINGIVNGLTGSYAFPSVIYLESLRLARDELIQGMGIMFLAASAALGISLAGQNVMDWSHAAMSAAALVPSLIGYYCGEHFRRRLPERTFRRIFLTGLLFLAAYTVVTSFFL
jgi:uncharacterized membrane protein YfcA